MLPQRRKSAEEIAKLRESLGVPGDSGEEPEAAPPAAVGFTPPSEPELKAAVAPLPTVARVSAVDPTPSSVVVGKPAEEGLAFQEEEPEPEEVPKVLSVQAPKLVRSLRKSEQAPVVLRAPDPADKVVRVDAPAIPQQRHSDRELAEMRRIQAAPPDRSISHLRHLAVPWPLIALGYVLPVAGGLFAWLADWTPGVPPMDFPAEWMADLSRQPWLGKAGFGLLCGLCGLGLIFAGGMALKKPRSRHHAGFITIIAVLILAFGIIHHFAPTYGP